MKIYSKVLFFLTIFFSFNFGYITSINGADAVPTPTVPCVDDPSGWEDPEFHSLRPYQASPCLDAPKATMCGNNVSVTLETVTARCKSPSSGMCPYNGPQRNKRVVIDLSNVKLPILGNTQNVTNSQQPVDSFDDAQKLNEYVSWYLAGSDQKAEYGVDSISKIINFSGPAKKLLPSSIKELNQFVAINNATIIPPATETANHNQIVVCTTHNILGINNPWFGPEIPFPCYDGNGSPSNGKPYRLLDWLNGNLSAFNTIFNIFSGGAAWNFRYPPFPWQFPEPIYYQKAYLEWRGLQCPIFIPSQNILKCFDFGLTPNTWADLYQYVPLSNTVDKKAKENYTSVQVTADAAAITQQPTIIINNVPVLFYPHTAEVSEATINLNKTFLPKEGVDTSLIPVNTEDNTSTCQLLDVRTNPGDDLTFDNTKPKHQIDFNAIYDVTAVGNCNPNYDIFGNLINYRCSSPVVAKLSLTTESPHLTDIWENTTAGAGSTFRMIFPKVGKGAPVSCLADIPGVSSATYNLNTSQSDSSVNNLQVKNPPSSTSIAPEIYFPHLGSVYEYFLKGIQTALRPQGYGEPITNGTMCAPTVGTGACKQWLLDPAIYNKVIAAAAAATCNGKSLNPAWALGIGFNENGGLMTDTIDGSSNSHFGCNVSQVQTIDEKISCMVNTLSGALHGCASGMTDAEILQSYGYAPGYVVWPVTILSPGSYPPPLFGSGFDVAGIISRLNSTDWRAAYASRAKILCPNSPNFPI